MKGSDKEEMSVANQWKGRKERKEGGGRKERKEGRKEGKEGRKEGRKGRKGRTYVRDVDFFRVNLRMDPIKESRFGKERNKFQ